MTFTGVMANLTVTDLDRSHEWYAAVVGREPDAAPMAGLLEWHLTSDPASPVGLQVYAEPERDGRSGIVLHTVDLAGTLARLDSAGISHDKPFDATESQVVVLADPDDNRVVITAPFASPRSA